MVFTASLGFWQLSRAAQKQALEDAITSHGALAPWTAGELAATSDLGEGFYRPVQLTGEWVAGATVYLDNRPMSARSGFIVVTPLRLKDQGQAILVQRGWVPRDFVDRARVPKIDSPAGNITVEGRLAPPPSKLFELGENQTGPIRQNIDIDAFARETGLELLSASVLQTAPAEEALLREWPRYAAGVQKHQGYALQWFAMCAAAAALYLWFQFISPRRKQRRHGPEPR